MNEQQIALPVSNSTESIVLQEDKHMDISDFLQSLRRPTIEKILAQANSVTSLIEASALIRNCADDSVREVIAIIHERILKNEIHGDDDDFHNMAVEVARKNMPDVSASICEHGISIWKDNIDLNADALTYLMDAGKVAEAASVAEKLEENCPDRTKWNWRGFTFLINYYLEVHPKGFEEKVSGLIKEFKKYLPHEEKAYTCDANRLVYLGKYREAMDVLEEAVANLNAPQCALTLADMYFERAKYEDAIRIATLGIAYAAESQPGIRVPYLIFLRAMAKDALYLKSGRTSQEEVRAIIREYELAAKYVSEREKAVVNLRMDILKTYADIRCVD